jgi:hypothetical protein
MKDSAYLLSQKDLALLGNKELPCAHAHSSLSYVSLIFASVNEQHGDLVMSNIGKAITNTIYGSLAFFIIGVGVGIAQAAFLGL